MSDDVKLTLADELDAPVAKTDLPYILRGESAPVAGGSLVSLGVNRPRKSKAGVELPVFVYLVHQDGRMQQAIPRRAVSAALAHQVIDPSSVVDLWERASVIDADCATLIREALVPTETETETETEAAE